MSDDDNVLDPGAGPVPEDDELLIPPKGILDVDEVEEDDDDLDLDSDEMM